ncbi:MAG: hypothetical protein ACI81T_000915, partial [Bacteroidia bacterium]
MKFIYAFIFVITIGFSASAQMDYSINLTPASEEYSELTWQGYSALVNLDDKIVKDVLKDRLKTFGKVQNQKKFWVVAPASISTLSTADVVVYYDKEGKNQTKIWMTVHQEGELQDELTQTTLYNLVYEIYEKDLNKKLEDAQKEQENLVKEADKLTRGIEGNENDIKNEEKKLKSSKMLVSKLKKDLIKAESKRDRAVLNLKNVSIDKKSDAQKDNEKAMEKVAKTKKKLISQEENQIDYAKDIRKNEEDIKKGEKDLKENEKKQVENK